MSKTKRTILIVLFSAVVIFLSVYFLIIKNGLDAWNSTTVNESGNSVLKQNDIKNTPESIEIGLIARRFYWTVWYPGKDNKFGETKSELIDDENIIGLSEEDKNAHDDIVVVDNFHLPVGKNIKFNIKSLDVVHSVYLPHFRVALPTAPGMKNSCEIKPLKTTEEMLTDTSIISSFDLLNKDSKDNGLSKEKVEFQYLLLCNKICGGGHYDMTMDIYVDTQEEFIDWLESQPTIEEKLNWNK